MKFRTEAPQILGATVHNLVSTTTRHREIVHPWLKTSLIFTRANWNV